MKSIIVLLSLFCSILINAQKSFEVRLTNNTVIFEDKLIDITALESKINSQIEKEKNESVISINVIIDNKTNEAFVKAVKTELNKTKIDILNIQRQTVSNFSANSIVNDSTIAQYNTLIKGWKNTPEDDRYYRLKELKFVENVYRKMDFTQQVNAQKLPSFLPIFDKQKTTQRVNSALFNKWCSNQELKVKINGKTIDQKNLKNFKASDFDTYFIERLIVNEKKEQTLNLFKN